LRYQIRNTIHEKNHEAHSLRNKILKDEITTKITKNILNKKITFKRMRVKIEIKK
jgi:metal-dependent HD superfamily phosphatase/phosphodiesterase